MDLFQKKNPFDKLKYPTNETVITQEFINEWVLPFYMVYFNNLNEDEIFKFAEASKKITTNIIRTLLLDYNWRTRLVGAYFCAIKEMTEFEDLIGIHLLKSELCCCGHGFCFALASFSNEKSKGYLNDYLNYYLDRPDLWYDQSFAIVALERVDKIEFDKIIPKWKTFVKNKPNWDMKNDREILSNYFVNLKEIQNLLI